MATDTVTEEARSGEGTNTDEQFTTKPRGAVAKDDPATRHLEWPETTVNPIRVRWRYALGIPAVHVLACLAFIPYFFSWTGVVLSILGLYIFGTLGINLCYHRLPPIHLDRYSCLLYSWQDCGLH